MLLINNFINLNNKILCIKIYNKIFNVKEKMSSLVRKSDGILYYKGYSEMAGEFEVPVKLEKEITLRNNYESLKSDSNKIEERIENVEAELEELEKTRENINEQLSAYGDVFEEEDLDESDLGEDEEASAEPSDQPAEE